MPVYAMVHEDLVSALASGIAGYIVPEDFADFSANNLRFNGTEIIAADTISDWLIDPFGRKRLPDMHPATGWQALTVRFDEKIIMDGGVWRIEVDADRVAVDLSERIAEIKVEVGRRIYAIASQSAQTNIATAVGVISGKTASARSNDEKAILADAETALGWVAAMRGNVAVLAANPALDMNDDANWPVTPAQVIALAAQF